MSVLTLSRRLASVLACAFLAAACSGGATTTTASTAAPTTAATTTVPPTTAPPLPTTTTTTTTTTTEPPGPVAPLTGLEVDEEITRPAFVLKIDNHQKARPQIGINQADVVFEELVEGNITRFAAVFHSTDADPVGPVRSARTGDYDLLTNLNTPLFGNSGGNPTVLQGLRSVDAVLLSDANVGSAAYYRVFGGRTIPHNLVTDTPTIYELADGRGGTPPALFEYREPDAALPSVARPIAGVEINYGGYQISYTWDAELGGWARTQQGSAHVDADGVPIAPPNVVVQFIEYSPSIAAASSPHAELLGTGTVWVLTDGHLVEGSWARSGETDITTLSTDVGETIALTPGRTWVALPKPGRATVVEPG